MPVLDDAIPASAYICELPSNRSPSLAKMLRLYKLYRRVLCFGRIKVGNEEPSNTTIGAYSVSWHSVFVATHCYAKKSMQAG
jgi:hypothetical protein